MPTQVTTEAHIEVDRARLKALIASERERKLSACSLLAGDDCDHLWKSPRSLPLPAHSGVATMNWISRLARRASRLRETMPYDGRES